MEGQMSLFDFAAEEDKKQYPDHHFRMCGEFPKEELLAFEKETLGIYVSGHPMEEYDETCGNRISLPTATDFMVDEETGRAVVEDGAQVTIGGMITGKTVKTTRNGQLMAFMTLEDLVGSVEVIVFPKDYENKTRASE
ncbi:MAG: OB-fold nucleic acid binding domain-containing protein [Clostridium sp.]